MPTYCYCKTAFRKFALRAAIRDEGLVVLRIKLENPARQQGCTWAIGKASTNVHLGMNENVTELCSIDFTLSSQQNLKGTFSNILNIVNMTFQFVVPDWILTTS